MSEAWRIRFRAPGGSDVLERETVTLVAPAEGEVRVRNAAVGVNFLDIYHRSGLYPLPLPSGIGTEAAGVVDAIGAGVSGTAVGDRVAYLAPKPSAYATHVTLGAEHIVPVPDSISFEIAAAALLKGLTAWMLVERIARAQPGTIVLVLAAAGGVGSIAVQWLKAVGATVIAHVGSEQKAALATRDGADHVLACPFDTLAQQVRALTGGRGVDAVFDGVGQASAAASIGSLARRGTFVSYGNASGAVPPIAPLELARAGSLFLTRPTLFDYVDTAETRRDAAMRLFGLIGDGAITVSIGRRLPLSDAVAAHDALAARQTTGSTILLP